MGVRKIGNSDDGNWISSEMTSNVVVVTNRGLGVLALCANRSAFDVMCIRYISLFSQSVDNVQISRSTLAFLPFNLSCSVCNSPVPAIELPFCHSSNHKAVVMKTEELVSVPTTRGQCCWLCVDSIESQFQWKLLQIKVTAWFNRKETNFRSTSDATKCIFLLLFSAARLRVNVTPVLGLFLILIPAHRI